MVLMHFANEGVMYRVEREYKRIQPLFIDSVPKGPDSDWYDLGSSQGLYRVIVDGSGDIDPPRPFRHLGIRPIISHTPRGNEMFVCQNLMDPGFLSK